MKQGLITLTAAYLEKKRELIKQLEGQDNPQLVVMRVRAAGEVRALEAVLDAMRGDFVMLRMEAEG